MDISSLKQAGLTEYEKKVYLTLLDFGELQAKTISVARLRYQDY